MANDLKDQHEKLLQLVQEALAEDKTLREKFQVGEKFKFIRDRLTTLLQRAQDSLQEAQAKVQSADNNPTEDEVLVYVYLYNSQGISLPTWQKMLKASVFYEYSVNRPIYTDKNAVEASIRAKANKVQHGYLSIVIHKKDILSEDGKDALNQPLIKVREGSLLFKRLINFTHNNNTYVVDEEGNPKLKFH